MYCAYWPWVGTKTFIACSPRSGIQRRLLDGEFFRDDEIGLLCERGRFRPARPLTEWRNTWLVAGLVEMPLDGVIATRALDLSGLSQDPADRFIAATAIIVGATLLTADALMLEWRHPLPRHDART